MNRWVKFRKYGYQEKGISESSSKSVMLRKYEKYEISLQFLFQIQSTFFSIYIIVYKFGQNVCFIKSVLPFQCLVVIMDRNNSYICSSFVN